jgi:hypothetical protein
MGTNIKALVSGLDEFTVKPYHPPAVEWFIVVNQAASEHAQASPYRSGLSYQVNLHHMKPMQYVIPQALHQFYH